MIERISSLLAGGESRMRALPASNRSMWSSSRKKRPFHTAATS
jgi:hypothetical protein